MPYDLVDHPGQIELFNVLHLFFTTVCSSQIIVASAKDFLDNGIQSVLLAEDETKEQILQWFQFVAGKRPAKDPTDVFFVCTFCEESRPKIEVAKTRLIAFFDWLQNDDITERFPSITLPQKEPVMYLP